MRSFLSLHLITRFLCKISCSTRFSLSFTILLVFTAFQHVFLCLSMFPRFSLLYPLIFEFCYKSAHIIIILRDFASLTAFTACSSAFALFQAYLLIFPYFSTVLRVFAAFSMIFCPYALFRQKIAYSLLLSAFCGYLRSFNLFHPVFPYNRAFAAVLTDFFTLSQRFTLFPSFTDLFRIFRAFLKDLSCFAVSLPYSAGF